jgi:UDP-N-acetylmuramyl pentapeptide synthase
MRDLLCRLASPDAQTQLAWHANLWFWPVVRAAAGFYRRVVVRRPRVVAVVGSVGKTTTTRAVMAVLDLAETRRVESNYLCQAGLALLGVRPGDRWAAIEVAIRRPGEMAPCAAMLRPDVAVVTRIASEHRTSLGTLEATRREKVPMVEALPRSGLAVLNGDDPNVLWMAGRTKARVVTYGFGAACDVRADAVRLDWPRGTRFRLHLAGRTRQVRVRLIGRHMVYPVLAASAVAWAEGVDLDAALARLEGLAPTAGRMEPVPLPSGAVVLRDDLKNPLETAEAALDVLAEVPARRRIVVLGMVAEPPEPLGPMYRRLGARLGKAAAQVIFCGPRRCLGPLRTGAVGAGLDRGQVVHAGWSVREALRALPADLGPGDVVFIKGPREARLERVAAALAGHDVGCNRGRCSVRMVPCTACPAFRGAGGG